ncbi:MAG: helix-turn-helix transcriptional regulator [Syntrophomonadaceae bacterium]
MALNERQERILEIVKKYGPITGEKISEVLNVTRAALRPDLAVLTMSGFLEAKPRVGYTFRTEKMENQIKKVLSQYLVRDIQSMPVIVKQDCSIYDAIVTLFIEDTGSIFVVDEENSLVGVVSRKDLLKTTLGHGDIHKVPVSVIMTRMPNVITVALDETVAETVRKLVEHEVDSLPVVKSFVNSQGAEKMEVVGKVTKTNLARFLLDLLKSN